MIHDVVLLGNGLASNLFARHLLLARPGTSVAVVGPAATPRFTVGESVTEVGSHYLLNRLRLTSYMFRNHLPKFGIRFFYDRPDHSLPLPEMSEDGTGYPQTYTTFHVDRWYLEQDLKALNREAGVVFYDGLVSGVDLADPHVVRVGDLAVRGRWVVDGTGRQRYLGRMLGLDRPVEGNFHSAAWAHFRCRNRIDEISDEWRRRNQFTSREFSTVHFVNDGYWIWVIPLRDETVSVGVVYDGRRLWPDGPPGQPELLRFLEGHRGLMQAVSTDEVLNFRTLERYSYDSEHYLSLERRYALLGDAAAFADPLYSPGMEMLAEASEMYVKLLGDDLDGRRAPARLANDAAVIDAVLRQGYRYYMTLVLGANGCMGCFEIMSVKYLMEFSLYFAGRLWSFVDRTLKPEGPAEAVRKRFETDHERMRFLTRNFVHLADTLRERGTYHRKNRSWRSRSLAGIYLEEHVHRRRDMRTTHLRLGFAQDVLELAILVQLQLFLERTDLLSHAGMAAFLGPGPVGELAARNTPAAEFFELCRARLQEEEDSPSFWPAWLQRVEQGVQTRQSGRNYERLREGLPFPDYPAPDRVTLEEPVIGRLVSRFQRVRKDPLAERPSDPHHAPFLLEAAAAGLFQRGDTLPEIRERLLPVLGPAGLPLILMGCGVGCRAAGRAASVRLDDWDAFLDGYGFAMGLEALDGGPPAEFPSAARRAPLVRGLARAATFMPLERNTPEKYRRAFERYGLYEVDVPAFSEGVGFSLAFTRAPGDLRTWLAGADPLLQDPHVRAGAGRAVALRVALFPSDYGA